MCPWLNLDQCKRTFDLVLVSICYEHMCREWSAPSLGSLANSQDICSRVYLFWACHNYPRIDEISHRIHSAQLAHVALMMAQEPRGFVKSAQVLHPCSTSAVKHKSQGLHYALYAARVPAPEYGRLSQSLSCSATRSSVVSFLTSRRIFEFRASCHCIHGLVFSTSASVVMWYCSMLTYPM